MTNRERARYYRQKDAAARAESVAAVKALHDQVGSLELQEHIHRQLLGNANTNANANADTDTHTDNDANTIAAPARANIVRLLIDFLNYRIDTIHSALHNTYHEFDGVQLTGDATAPIVRLDCSLRGRLLPSLVRQIYPHIIGNTVLLDRLMHEDMEYACRCWFYFSPDGMLDYHVVEMDGVGAINRVLENLQTVGRIIADIGGL
ncbi:hypothetical protein Poli38472_006977 [Pythium oligandrum]|uniref:Uncharacterized protein n=1 Tax=Pythium oligandrum TaxID=41045 RepID=A0A8K1FGL7_PYTOL|nr:hypothetical protein Poli38472_006977 [Pythium oligandrum]|eukprot:TMW58832.1 hypothetical protein Poli38472_006977 [Pythium oligandrum]